MTTTNHLLRIGLALTLAITTACGGDDDSGGTPDAPPAGDPDGAAPATTWRQLEHLARPGIAEALLLSNDFLAGYNGTAPTFTGVPAETLGAVVGEAKTVLKAIYLGVCLVNGGAGLTAATGLKPAGMTCAEVGGGLFSDGAGTILEPAVVTAAQAYADAVFDQFEPDVMRIDTAADSGYLTLCDGPTTKPLLCGGRTLTDDTIDITYDYLLAGAAIHLAADPPAQLRALVSDGVQYDDGGAGSQNSGNVTPPDPANPGQFHPPVLAGFPYSAPPN
jgi:hypothetical protein